MSQIAIATVLKSMDTPILLIGSDQRISMQNPAATAVLKSDFTGRNYLMAFRQPDLLDVIEKSQKDGIERSATYLARIGSADQTFEARIVPEGDEVLIILNDQSAQRELDVLRRDFVANVSHELRTPLTAISGFIETLQGPARDDPKAQARFLGIMAREADRMRELVDGLLSLSRVEENERSRPSETVDLNLLVDHAAELLAPVAAKAGTHLMVAPHDHKVSIPGDISQLQQVLRNLIENAIKYGATDAGIAVTIHAPAYEPALQQDCVRLSVQDHGIGIPARHLVRLTERFYRVDNHRDRAQGGTGLGLAIVKHIVNRHRGRLIFDSVEGQGTTASVLLPLDAGQIPTQRRGD